MIWLLLLGLLLILILVTVVVFLLILKRKRDEESIRGAFTNFTEAPNEFSAMSQAEYTSTLSTARTNYLAWAGTQEPLERAQPGQAGTSPLSEKFNVPEFMKNLFISFAASPDTIFSVVSVYLNRVYFRNLDTKQRLSVFKFAKEEARTLSGQVRNIAKLMIKGPPKALVMQAQRTGMASSVKLLASATARMTSRVALMAALTAAGPAGWVVEAALFAISATLGMLDQFGVGGYEELITEKMYMGLRDYWDRELQEECKKLKLPYPLPYGPIEKLGAGETLEKELDDAILTIFNNENHPITKLYIALISDFYVQNKRLPTQAEKDSLLNNDPSGIVSKMTQEAYRIVAAKYNGKIVLYGDDGICSSYLTKEETEKNVKWPPTDETDYYFEWDDATKTSYVRPGLMRKYAEDLGFGCTYDPVRRLPKITEAYCQENGLYFDGRGKECKYREGQAIAEMIFGKAFIRGLLQVFDPQMYKKCSEMNWCKDGKCKEFGGYFCMKNNLSYTRTGVAPRCPSGYSETTPGFCNKDCPDGFFRLKNDQICYDNRIKNNGSILTYPVNPTCDKIASDQHVRPEDPNRPYTFTENHIRPTLATRCYHYSCEIKNHQPHWNCVKQTSPGKDWIWPRRSCKDGYTERNGSCWAISRPLETAKPKLGTNGIGECPSGTSKYLKGDALCYESCKEGFQNWPAGLCNSTKPSLVIRTKERKAPFGKTNFEDSPVGQRIQAIKDNIREGDVAGVGAGIGALMLQTHPIVTGIGVHDSVNMIPNI